MEKSAAYNEALSIIDAEECVFTLSKDDFWQYIGGMVSDLTREESDELWNWYVK